MLGDVAQWVQNVRAAHGRAFMRSGGRTEVQLVEVPAAQRAPILKAYLQRALGARPHIPVDKDAPLAEFEAVSALFPVFQIVPVQSSGKDSEASNSRRHTLNIGTIAASMILILHGLVHLLGAASYTKLAVIQQLPYKTTFLGGLDLDTGGTAVYGGLWAVAAIGFIVSAVALLAGWKWWKPALVGVTVLSLALTALVWSDARIGVIVNMVILAVLWLGPRTTGWLSPRSV